MLRIEKTVNGKISFSLSGHMETADIEELRKLFGVETAVNGMVLNLRQLVAARWRCSGISGRERSRRHGSRRLSPLRSQVDRPAERN